MSRNGNKSISVKTYEKREATYFTETEKEILTFIALGYTDAFICVNINMKTRTLEKHMYNIRDKCKVIIPKGYEIRTWIAIFHNELYNLKLNDFYYMRKKLEKIAKDRNREMVNNEILPVK